MFKLLFLLISLICLTNCACPPDFFEVYNDCFQLITFLPVNWTTAETWCEDSGGHLAFINDCNTLTEVSIQVDLLEPTSLVIWIGASDAEEEGVWKWLDGTDVPLGVPFWGSSPPGWIPEPSGGSNADCAHLDMYDQYHFHDEDCTRLGNPLCQTDPIPDNETISDIIDFDESFEEEFAEGDCPEGFIQVQDSCFYFYYNKEFPNITVNWYDAQTACNEVYPGAYLAILNECEKTYQIPVYSGYWVSANDIAEEGHWVWGDNTDDNWLPEPGGGYEENCGAMLQYDRYYFHDGECDLEAYALCQQF
ncbi:Hepatic lectin [Armadillidium nasatum]|uniref:Hepatic lectin n=1 Tax=Armadillidium nasatum TaxID=96803 RepID=A0A5N5T7B7_9CRUS|nr:Hepatic lectin [Armadillidium nasatum]